MKLEGHVEPPQDMMEEYNGYSIPQYIRYRLLTRRCKGSALQIKQNVFCKLWKILSFGIDLVDVIGSISHLHKTNKDDIHHQK